MSPRTVVVAMSGGVDSSVAAALCVEAGHDVVGIMLRLWAEPGATGANKCCTLGAIDDAEAVAARLGIPFSVLDITDRFYDVVVKGFVEQAARLETPNPCFTCNREIRFGFLADQAVALGADYLATGHYARVRRDDAGSYWLHRGLDPMKDQSYVLYRLSQPQLARAMFPVGELTKTEVRAQARRFGLEVASRPDSVDLCWTGPDGVRGFLTRQLAAREPLDEGPGPRSSAPPAASGGLRPGPIVDGETGALLGRHEGLALYTVGQRKGLGIAIGTPRYVLEQRAADNTLVVGSPEALLAADLHVGNMHWTAGHPPAAPFSALAQQRYKATAAPARVEPLGADEARVTFDTPQRAPTPGQGLVLYDGDRVLGGGLIRR